MRKFIFFIIIGIVSGVLLTYTTTYAKTSSEQQEKKTITKKENKKLLNPRKISIDEMKELIDRGADVNIRDRNQHTSLHLLTAPNLVFSDSVDPDTIEKIKLLISAGADVNAQTNRGETPLHGYEPGLVAPQDPRIISILIEAGADPNLKAYGGNTVLDLYEKAVDTLIERIHKYSMIKDLKMVNLYQVQLQKYEEQIMTLKAECERKGIKLLSEKDFMYEAIEYEKGIESEAGIEIIQDNNL